MSDKVIMYLAKEILGDSREIFLYTNRGISKDYLFQCFEDPTKLRSAFYWKPTIQGDKYWRECCEKAIPKEKIQERLSILLPLIYDKPLTLEDLM